MFWELVRHQGGLITRDQARQRGWTDRQMASAVANGQFELVLPTVFRHRAAPRPPGQLVVAVSLWLGASGELAGATAGRLWRLDRVPFSPVVTGSSWTRRSPDPSVRIQRRRLGEGDVTTRRELRVTTPERTIVDLAASLSRARLESAIESAFRQERCTPAELYDAAIVTAHSQKGRRSVLEWLHRRGDGPALEYELEQRTFEVIARSGLPTAERQHQVWVDGIPWAVDLSWPDVRVGVECDGFGSHVSPDAFRKDREKLAALVSVGWSILPVTWDEITRHEDRFIGRVRSALLR
jgi:very-short-patch-repair endonuclease